MKGNKSLQRIRLLLMLLAFLTAIPMTAALPQNQIITDAAVRLNARKITLEQGEVKKLKLKGTKKIKIKGFDYSLEDIGLGSW